MLYVKADRNKPVAVRFQSETQTGTMTLNLHLDKERRKQMQNKKTKFTGGSFFPSYLTSILFAASLLIFTSCGTSNIGI
jgi:hypothetical protein